MRNLSPLTAKELQYTRDRADTEKAATSYIRDTRKNSSVDSFKIREPLFQSTKQPKTSANLDERDQMTSAPHFEKNDDDSPFN